MTDFKSLILIMFLCFSCCLFGCKTTNPINNREWNIPSKPINYSVKFVQKDNGLYIDEVSSKNLLKNVEGMDAYILKLETLVDEMIKYYGEK